MAQEDWPEKPGLLYFVVFAYDGWRQSYSLKTAGKVDSVAPAIGFPGLVQEEDVNPASTAFTTMISQPCILLFLCTSCMSAMVGLTLTRYHSHQTKSPYQNLHLQLKIYQQ